MNWMRWKIRTTKESSMTYRSIALSVSIALVAVPSVAQEQDFSKVEIATTKVADGIYMLEGAGGNIGVSAGADGVFLIDDQYAPLTEKIVAAVTAIDDGPIRFVLNTHWHGDHTGGNENLGEAGTLIVAHDNVRRQMTVGQFFELWDRTVEPSSEASLPVVTFSDTVTFHLNGQEIHAFHVAHAHTDGDSMVHFGNLNVLHMGDVFFNGIFPFIDVYSGGSLSGMIAACNQALHLVDDDTAIIPGHGPLANRADLVRYRDMLQTAHGAIAPMVRRGMSLEEVQAAEPLAPLVEQWGGGFITTEQFIGLVYQGMSR
jgi:glyoxylase-like metal-dependent hydrolase (beta-lactamase superfamily II)